MASQSPDQSEKQKRKQKRQKLKAFQSFLQKNQSSPSSFDLVSTNLSDQQQKIDEAAQTCCCVCKVELGDRKKNCGFCKQPVCGEHLRKKRKSKQEPKFVRICDNCEDKYLYNKYMKLEVKFEESMAAQESIVQSKKDELEKQFEGRRGRLRVLENQQKQLQAQKKDHQAKLAQQENEYKAKLQKLQKKMKQLDNLEKQLQQLQSKLPPSFEDDFHALELQNDKVNKQLLKHQKLCSEAIKAKSKRQRQIYDQYNQWQHAQRQKLTKKQQDCTIF